VSEEKDFDDVRAQEKEILSELDDQGETKECPKCNGVMIEGSFEILNFIQADFGHNLLIGPHKTFYMNPKRRSQINVFVCKKCGFTEMYATNPVGL
jgi:predicted nucleic-acid-binding Zn-ribbon protein